MKRIPTVMIVGILCLSMFSVFALGVRAQQSPVDWWSMFHHDLTHIGYSTSTVPSANQTLWSYTTSGAVYSSPAVVDGVVYVGSADGNVYAFAASASAGLLPQIETYAVIAVVVIVVVAIVAAVYLFVRRRKPGQPPDQGMHT